MQLTVDQVCIGILFIFLVNIIIDQYYNKEHFGMNEAAPGPQFRGKVSSAKECSDESVNHEILNYQLSTLNQTKK